MKSKNKLGNSFILESITKGQTDYLSRDYWKSIPSYLKQIMWKEDQ